MKLIKDLFRKQSEYAALREARADAHRIKKPILAAGLSEGAKYAFFACLCEDSDGPTLILVPDEKDAVKVGAALSAYGLSAAVYNYRDFSYHNVPCSHEYEQERIGVLAMVLEGSVDCVIATPDAAMQCTVPKERLSAFCRKVQIGDVIDLNGLAEELVSFGYRRVTAIDGIGQFAVRGGIIDVFSPNAPNPVRIELYGDETDSMGYFDIMSQRRTENVSSFLICPAREVIPDEEERAGMKAAAAAQKNKAKKEAAVKLLEGEIEALSEPDLPDFADKYVNIVYPGSETLFDYFGKEDSSLIICDDPAGLRERAEGSAKGESLAASLMIESEEIAGKYAKYSMTYGEFETAISDPRAVFTDNFAASNRNYADIFTFRSKSPLSYNESFRLLTEDAENYVKNKYAVLLLCENAVVAKSFSEMFYEEGEIAPCVSSDAAPDPDGLFGKINIIYPCGAVGFISDSAKTAVISLYRDSSLYGRAIKTRRKAHSQKRTARERILSYTDLNVGDYVVHDAHGIGVFEGLKTLVGYDGCEREFLRIKYAENGVLYVPCDRLDTLSKYIGTGSADGTVRVNRLGSADWEKSKTRVKAAAREMAKELIELYAKRMRRPGISFPEDDDLQRQFESLFEYEETEGQLTAAEEIKKDMQSNHPMDRLLCGDVGFGKTEVALRAVFKAAECGYQAAILVPTTILALQHYQTIMTRMRGFPLEIDMISRFRTPAQQKETLRKLKRGDVDIIVGTHRLLSSDVEFKKLGLIVVDEEQRFGVAHKEKLKMMQNDADVLTLTATPIPRTLSMAISGIRDMSVLEEAPGDRLPPQTYVMEYDELIISDAIKKELRRGGQVFYLYNNVENIEVCAARVKKMCPDATVKVAHGKMDKEELSDIWREVVGGEIDVLVCTTIIETGVDVPNANTLIIENADRLGLSQLHQIRGRIGRSSRRSYAYFTYRPMKLLSEIAEKRLEAIREYTEFGSGFKIALRDLEIRGAGNILGEEQHGHMDAVGYDMYIKLLNEAVLSEQGVTKEEALECKMNLGISAVIREKYIENAQLRIEMYKKISHIASLDDLDDVADELMDRFGEIPRETADLLYISLLRSYGERLNVSTVERKENRIIFRLYKFDAEKWVKITSKTNGRLIIYPGREPLISFSIRSKEEPVRKLCEMIAAGMDEQQK
ncbi:MAG: transcription-repair coupling factor [Clostridia bacterium]|nr:transcription-repair coupling factor [Clostridia bacterium]